MNEEDKGAAAPFVLFKELYPCRPPRASKARYKFGAVARDIAQQRRTRSWRPHALELVNVRLLDHVIVGGSKRSNSGKHHGAHPSPFFCPKD